MKLKKQNAQAVTLRPYVDTYTGKPWIEVVTPSRRFWLKDTTTLYSLLDLVT